MKRVAAVSAGDMTPIYYYQWTSSRFLRRSLVLLWMLAGALTLPALAVQAAEPAPQGDRSIGEWLLRLHEAARQRSFVGTVVVTQSGGGSSAAKVWHVCDGRQQIEKIESLTGAPRTTIRRNEQVVTFLQDSRVVRNEQRQGLATFPGLLRSGNHTIADHYLLRSDGSERVAGHDAERFRIVPKDTLRYGYRIWSERTTGLMLRIETLDGDGKALEQVAFTELQINAPVRMEHLSREMTQTDGYRQERLAQTPTTAAEEGWHLRTPVAGFRPVSCYRRGSVPSGAAIVQWTFSDGLATVSLFMEPHDRQRHQTEGARVMGATGSWGQRTDDWWITAVGEVPLSTLQLFAKALVRRP